MAIGWTSIYRNPATGKYQLWYQAYAGGRDKRKSHKCVVCYAESDNGVQFTKPSMDVHDFETDRLPWDRHCEKTNIVLIGDGGYNSGAIGGGTRLTDASQQSGVGFASIPLDRFAGIRPVKLSAQSTLKKPLENVGQVTLKPTRLANVQSIRLNADASEGAVRVEVLNEDGYRMRGSTKEDVVELNGDSLSHHVAWKDRALADLPPSEYMLRLHLENAEVFAVSIE